MFKYCVFVAILATVVAHYPAANYESIVKPSGYQSASEGAEFDHSKSVFHSQDILRLQPLVRRPVSRVVVKKVRPVHPHPSFYEFPHHEPTIYKPSPIISKPVVPATKYGVPDYFIPNPTPTIKYDISYKPKYYPAPIKLNSPVVPSVPITPSPVYTFPQDNLSIHSNKALRPNQFYGSQGWNSKPYVHRPVESSEIAPGQPLAWSYGIVNKQAPTYSHSAPFAGFTSFSTPKPFDTYESPESFPAKAVATTPPKPTGSLNIPNALPAKPFDFTAPLITITPTYQPYSIDLSEKIIPPKPHITYGVPSIEPLPTTTSVPTTIAPTTIAPTTSAPTTSAPATTEAPLRIPSSVLYAPAPASPSSTPCPELEAPVEPELITFTSAPETRPAAPAGESAPEFDFTQRGNGWAKPGGEVVVGYANPFASTAVLDGQFYGGVSGYHFPATQFYPHSYSGALAASHSAVFRPAVVFPASPVYALGSRLGQNYHGAQAWDC